MSLYAESLPSTGITAKQQMIWQEQMSNSAHMREMADLKAAGLNPWLSSNSGASTPAGSQDSADTIMLLNGIADVLDKAHGSSKQVADDDKTKEVQETIDEVLGALAGVFPFGLRKLVTLSSTGGNAFWTDYFKKHPDHKKKLDDIVASAETDKAVKSVTSAFKRSMPFRKSVKRHDFTKY